jgi:hypothetical protein
MGLGSKKWVETLKENKNFAHCFTNGKLSKGKTHILDMGLEKYCWVIDKNNRNESGSERCYTTGKALKENIIKLLLDLFLEDDYENINILLDGNAPENKGETQAKRREGKTFLTKEDLPRIKNLLPINDMALPDLNMVLNTSFLCNDLFRFITESILYTPIEELLNIYCKHFESNNIKELRSLWKNKLSGKTITILDGRLKVNPKWKKTDTEFLPKLTFKHISRSFYKDLDLNEIKDHVDFLSYFNIGEAEQKILHIVEKYLGSKIHIKCRDGDILPIMLMNMERLIKPDEDFISTEILIDLGKNSILNIVELFRSIVIYFQEKKIMLPPIQTVCGLMALLGNDYVEDMMGIGSKKAWKYLLETNENWKLLKIVDNDFIYIDSIDPEFEYYTLNEEVWLNLIALLYSNLYDSKTSVIYNWNQLEKMCEKKKENCKSTTYFSKINITKNSHVPFRAVVRRTWWTLNYWKSGSQGKIILPVTEKDTQGISRYGWKLVTEEINGETVYLCKRAEVVSTLG